MQTSSTYSNPVICDDTDHGDPAVLKYRGRYYLYHSGARGVPVYVSDDLVQWESAGTAFSADPSSSWYQVDIWAPEIMYFNGVFYMYLTGARLKRGSREEADDRYRFIGVATSPSPTGPFTAADRPLADEWSIDAHPFRDPDTGRLFLFYNVRSVWTLGPGNVIGCGNVYDTMDDPVTLTGNPRLVVKPEHEFEGAVHRDGEWYWNEGPFVLKHEGRYHQIYSAGFFGDDSYAMYEAVTADPLEDGERDPVWSKRIDAALLRSNDACWGPGHCTAVVGPDGHSRYLVYHAYVPGELDRGRQVWVSAIRFDGGRLVADAPDGAERQAPAAPDRDLRGTPPDRVLEELARPILPGPIDMSCWVRASSGNASSALTLRVERGRSVVNLTVYGDRVTGIGPDPVRIPHGPLDLTVWQPLDVRLRPEYLRIEFAGLRICKVPLAEPDAEVRFVWCAGVEIDAATLNRPQEDEYEA